MNKMKKKYNERKIQNQSPLNHQKHTHTTYSAQQETQSDTYNQTPFIVHSLIHLML